MQLNVSSLNPDNKGIDINEIKISNPDFLFALSNANFQLVKLYQFTEK